jgi:uncharacterized protein
MVSALVITVVTILFLLGVVGTILPGLPGTGLIFIGIIMYAAASGFSTITPVALLLFAVVTVLAVAANYIGSLYGTKAAGGKGWAIGGTIVGGLIGTMTVGPLGLVAGAFLGALAGAMYEGQDSAAATKTAVYSIIGIIGGTLVQLVIGISMIAAFLVMVV